MKDKMLFSFSDQSNEFSKKVADFMGVKDSDLPTLRAVTTEKLLKYTYQKALADLTVENIEQFVDGIYDGSIYSDPRSEAIPKSNDGPVTVIVGFNHEEIVQDTTKDVLVLYYAPWCEHCKKLLPIWDQLGEIYKDNKDLVIGKLDDTTNYPAGVDIKAYPTIVFYPRDKKKGINFSKGK